MIAVRTNKYNTCFGCQDCDPDWIFKSRFLPNRLGPKSRMCKKFRCNPFCGFGEIVIMAEWYLAYYMVNIESELMVNKREYKIVAKLDSIIIVQEKNCKKWIKSKLRIPKHRESRQSSTTAANKTFMKLKIKVHYWVNYIFITSIMWLRTLVIKGFHIILYNKLSIQQKTTNQFYVSGLLPFK